MKNPTEPTEAEKEISLKASTGGLSGFILHMGRYPNSYGEYEAHFKDCGFCRRKEQEYNESSLPAEVRKGVYRHFKGKDYLVLGEATHSETQEKFILYMPLYGEFRFLVRPKIMFLEEVDKPEYKYKGPRFRYIGEL